VFAALLSSNSVGIDRIGMGARIGMGIARKKKKSMLFPGWIVDLFSDQFDSSRHYRRVDEGTSCWRISPTRGMGHLASHAGDK